MVSVCLLYYKYQIPCFCFATDSVTNIKQCVVRSLSFRALKMILQNEGFPVGLRVLVVDDVTCLKLMDNLLKKCQYKGTVYDVRSQRVTQI